MGPAPSVQPSADPPTEVIQAPEPDPVTRAPTREPLFTENRGQYGSWPARFYSHGDRLSVALGDGWVAYDVHGAGSMDRVVRVTFPGSLPVAPEGSGEAGHVSHYLLGRDPSGWVTDVPSHPSVVYRDLWDGVDLRYLFEDGMLKYEFTVAPGVDPGVVTMAYEGADSLEVCPVGGDLLVRVGATTLRDHAPVTYQLVGGRSVEVPSSFRPLGEERIGFRLADHDPGLPLVIDPGLMFCTLLGGSGDDVGNDVAADNDGFVYVVGHTTGSSFPVTAGAYDTSFNNNDAFLSKFSPNGSALNYSTFIGGSQDDEATGVEVAPGGALIVAGTTISQDFPTTSGAFCSTLSNNGDAFVLKLDVFGSSLHYSTFVGGSLGEVGTAVEVDSNGFAYLAGYTFSSDFPKVAGSFRKTSNRSDVFVVKVKKDGSGLVYSCVLGGNWSDEAYGLAIDSAGAAYVTGSTGSPWYPTTAGAFNPVIGSKRTLHDVFVTKINATGATLDYSTFIGSTGYERGWDIDVDRARSAYVVGFTGSGLFPQMPRPPDLKPYKASVDSFVLKLDPTGARLVYSKVIEMAGYDEARGVGVDYEGCVMFAGYMSGNGRLNVSDTAFQPTAYNDKVEGYVLRLDAEGDRFLYGSYLGGDKDDYVYGLALDGDGLVHLTGSTHSTQGFPTTPDAYDNTSQASDLGDPSGDAFVCKMDISLPYLIDDLSSDNVTTGDPYLFYLNIGDNAGVKAVGLEYWYGENGTHANLSLQLMLGEDRNGFWGVNIWVPPYMMDILYYRVWARDISGLNCTLRDYSLLVRDNDEPILENLSPAQTGTGNTVNLSVRVVDNIAVGKVAALYTGGLLGLGRGGGPAPLNVTGQDGDVYNFTVTMPWYSNETFEYRFWANDTSGNFVLSDLFQLEVLDDDRPMMTVDRVPEEVTTGGEIYARIHVRDNLGVDNVTCTWWLWGENGTGPQVVPMNGSSLDALGNGHYTITLQVPLEIPAGADPRIGLSFLARDRAGNNVSSPLYWVDVLDDEPPWFLEDLSSENATTGDPFTFGFRVMDNVGLERVFLRYWFGAGRTVESPLVQDGDGAWVLTIQIPVAWTALHYIAGATDVTGFTNWSAQGDRKVIDNDAPVVLSDASDREGTTGDPVTFKVVVEDNLFVAEVRVIYWMADGIGQEISLTGKDLDSGRNGTYRGTMDAPSDASGTLTYVVEAVDLDGNVGSSEARFIDIVDDDVPWFGRDLSDEEAWRGEGFDLNVEVWDNVGLESLWCEWWFGDGERTNDSVPLGNPLGIVIPLEPGGPLRYRFAVRDGAGNWNATQTSERTVLNQPPAFVGLDTWTVTEDEEAELDLLQYVEDRDDTEWSFTVNRTDSDTVLQNHTLHVLHRASVPDYRLELSVSDGRDVAWHNISVHVVAVNDAPEIVEVRYNGALFDPTEEVAEFPEGGSDFLTVLAMDEEGDPLTYVWRKGDEEVHQGEVLRRGDLPNGMYDLTLEVSDGTDSANYTLTVSVLDEDREVLTTSFPWIVLLVVVMVVAVLVAIMAWKRGRSGGQNGTSTS